MAALSPEAAGPHSTSPEALANPDVRNVVESDVWRELAPNHASEVDLLPSELGAEQVEAILDTIKAKDLAGDTDAPVELPGLGMLEKLGDGEAKTVYSVTTPDGRKMVATVGGGIAEGGAQVPEDPNFTLIARGLGRNTWEYSDLRTYLVAPIDDYRTISLQEYGGEAQEGVRSAMARLSAAERVRRTIKSSIGELSRDSKAMVDRELAHKRHYLKKPGQRRLSVIDIPLVEIT